jgi:regulator of nonsense transcripts 2
MLIYWCLDTFPVQNSLDSSLKKNTAFIKRLRTGIASSALSTFLQEVRSLSLEKYLSEIISACYEGLCKLKTPTDIAAGVEIVSALHQRFGPDSFTGYLAWNIGRGLSTPDKSQLKTLPQDIREKEEKERLTRQRILLRVATELWLVGVLRSLDDVIRPDEAGKGKDGAKVPDPTAKNKTSQNGVRTEGSDVEPFPLEVLKDLLGHDREHINLPLVVLFVKNFAWDVLGVKLAATDERKSGQEGGSTTTRKTDDTSTGDEEDASHNDPPITSPELRQLFKNVLMRYFDDVKNHLVKDQKALIAQRRRNEEAYVRSGEVFEDREAKFANQSKAQEKFIANTQVLADAIGAEMPDLKEKEVITTTGESSIGLVKVGDYLRGQGEGAGIWEDEEERRFYENLVDLKDRVPGILLEDGKKKKADGEEQIGKKTDTKASAEFSDKSDATNDKLAENDDQSTAIANKSVGAQVDAVLARLPEFTNKDMVDQVAIDFTFLNSKASRNRMIKALEDIPKGRTDLLPFYGRLISTLGKHMPDIAQALVAYLDDEFRSLQRRKTKEFLGQVRLQNVRYLAELTKFGIVPEHIIFHCFKVCLDDFSRMNIEIMANLMENCGRYLLRNPETQPRMTSFLEAVQRKKAAQHLGQQERMLLENALYYVNPPERAAIEQKERTPVELFLRKLIYEDLTKRNFDKIVKQIRKLHWEEDEIVTILLKIFTKPSKIKYSNIHLLALILSSLHRYHQGFTVMVIDDLLESITLGLELNDFKLNQRRLSEVKYLAELYIYRMVDSSLIFDTMYKILTYGLDDGTPKPGVLNPLDLPDDFFRARLICSLLETCGVFYDKGVAKKKLDFFLIFFQYYLQTKDPLPMDIDFAVQDAYALVRPDWKLVTTLEEAGKIFAEAVKQNYQAASHERPVDPEDADEAQDDSVSDDGEYDEDINVREGAEEKSSGDDAEVCLPTQFAQNVSYSKQDTAEDDEADEEDRLSSDEEEENIIVSRQQEQRDPEIDADFDREFAKMMAESLQSRQTERKPMFDVALPMRKARDATTIDEQGDSETPTSPGMMKFSLLSKRGNRQQVS